MRASAQLRIVALLCGAAVSCSSTRQDDAPSSSRSPPARDAGSSGDRDTGQAEGTCGLPNEPIPAGGGCSDIVTHCAEGTDDCLSTALRATLAPAMAACKIGCGDLSVGFSAGCATVLEGSGGFDSAAADCLRNILFHARYDCVPTDGWQRLYAGSCTLP